jgi:adenosylcobinamide-GDP ribazoletransferase
MIEVESPVSDVAPDENATELVERDGLGSSFVAAVQFLTRIPIATGMRTSPTAFQQSLVFFPVVGALIGICTAVCIGLGGLVWPTWLAVFVALAVEARLTGAIHEDAVADFCDAFGGGWSREEVLTILKDSRIGTYGALGLFLAVAIRASATIAIVAAQGITNPWIWGSAIVASAMLGRWVMVLAMFCLPPVPRRESLARDISRGVSVRDLLVSGFAGIPFAVSFAYCLPWNCLVAILLVTLAVWRFHVRVKQKIGGTTGDCLGFIGYVAQLLVLLAAAMKFEWWGSLS